YLDGSYEKIAPGSWVVVDTAAINPNRSFKLQTVANNTPLLIGQAARVAANIARAKYGMSGKSTRIEIAVAGDKRDDAAWMKFVGVPSQPLEPPDDFQMIRRTVVYAQAEKLSLTEEPIDEDICTTGTNGGWIVLDGIYSELKSGRW